LYIFRPSLLIGARREVRAGEKIGIAISKVVQFGLVGKLRKYRPVQSETVAGGMLGASLESRPGRMVCHFDDIVRLSAAARR
jgi:hypothetical protein